MDYCYHFYNKPEQYFTEANKLSPSFLEEKLGVLYSTYSPPYSLTGPAENKRVLETSFIGYPGLKVYI